MDCKKRIKELEEQVKLLKSATGQWAVIQKLLDESNRKLMKAEKKLKNALIRAEETKQAKNIFLANISHEIRTPLNGIIGMVEVLGNTDLTKEQREYLDIILSSSESLLQIINDILDLSKIEAGKIEFESIEFDIRNVIFSVSNILIPHINKQNIELITYVDPRLPDCLYGDPVRLKQVLLNLANNAVKFTNVGEVFIRAEIINAKKNTVGLRVSVQDTGIGISKANQRKIFGTFSQADSSTTRKYGGTGLGLSISKKLTEGMGGTIDVESELGKGSTFYFDISFETCGELKKKAENINPPIKALVMDDSRTFLQVIDEYLDFMGCENVLLDDFNKLEKLLKQTNGDEEPFDVMIVDFSFIDHSEISFWRKLKRKKLFKNTKIVLLIPLGLVPMQHEEYKGIFDAVITKPVKFNVLKSTVYELTGNADKLDTDNAWEFNGKLDYKVLLVDDNNINIKVGYTVLSKIFKKVEVARNGKEAVYKHNAQKFDFIFMDMFMPEMDGLEASRIIREKDSEVVIIAMSANAVQNDFEKCLRCGINEHVPKPYKAEQIRNVVRKYLDQ